MDAIPLNRMTTLRSFVTFLRRLGAPVDSGLRRAKLPVWFEELPHGWIPSPQQWQFIADMASREGITDLGLQVGLAEGPQGLDSAFGRPIAQAATLAHALMTIAALVRRQASHMCVWLERHGAMVHVCHAAQLPPEVPGYEAMTWRTTHRLIEIVREFAGAAWQPPEIRLVSPTVYGRTAAMTYPDTQIRVGQAHDAVLVPPALLPARRQAPSALALEPPVPDTATALDPPTDFVASLRALLRPYLLDGYPSVDFVAELAGCSRRTLQRRLATAQLSHSKLVALVRFDAALEAMADPNQKLIDIALQLGYGDQATFSRAFQRWTGLAPGAFRRQYRGLAGAPATA